jgi:hypothetical protein
LEEAITTLELSFPSSDIFLFFETFVVLHDTSHVIPNRVEEHSTALDAMDFQASLVKIHCDVIHAPWRINMKHILELPEFVTAVADCLTGVGRIKLEKAIKTFKLSVI